MCCDQLVCGRCAHPVSEGRCPVCRASRSELHGPAPVNLAAVLAGVLLLLALLALVADRLTG